MAPILRWLLDTTDIWPAVKTSTAYVRQSDPTADWAKDTSVSFSLSLLPTHEKEAVLRFRRPSDAKLSLGSFLLKHLAIVRCCDVPWAESNLDRAGNGKPCYIPKDPNGKKVEFNVSHHGQVVVLIACVSGEVRLGVDIVHVDWIKDKQRAEKEGFEAWVHVFTDVFSDAELLDILTLNLSTLRIDYRANLNKQGFARQDDMSASNDEILSVVYQMGKGGAVGKSTLLQARFRRFYTFWCLKEAYIKMTGEALLAKWLRQLEFRDVQSPHSSSQMGKDRLYSPWGEIITGTKAFLHGKPIESLDMELQAFGDNYIIGSAAERTAEMCNVAEARHEFQTFEILDLEKNVYPYATTQH